MDERLSNSGWPIGVGFPMEETNSVRVSVVHFTGRFAWDLAPASNDWTITGKGAVVGRMTWAGLEWTRAVEASVLAFADRMTLLLAECC
jgi:hypothetical protein